MENVVDLVKKVSDEIQNLMEKHRSKKYILGVDQVREHGEVRKREIACQAATAAMSIYKEVFETQDGFYDAIKSEDPQKFLEKKYLSLIEKKAGVAKVLGDLFNMGLDWRSIPIRDDIREKLLKISTHLREVQIEVDELNTFFVAAKNCFELPSEVRIKILNDCTVTADDYTKEEIFYATLFKTVVQRWIEKYDYQITLAWPEVSFVASRTLSIVGREPFVKVNVNLEPFASGLSTDRLPHVRVTEDRDSNGCPILEIDGQLFKFRYRHVSGILDREESFDFSKITENDQLLRIITLDRQKNLGILDAYERQTDVPFLKPGASGLEMVKETERLRSELERKKSELERKKSELEEKRNELEMKRKVSE